MTEQQRDVLRVEHPDVAFDDYSLQAVLQGDEPYPYPFEPQRSAGLSTSNYQGFIAAYRLTAEGRLVLEEFRAEGLTPQPVQEMLTGDFRLLMLDNTHGPSLHVPFVDGIMTADQEAWPLSNGMTWAERVRKRRQRLQSSETGATPLGACQAGDHNFFKWCALRDGSYILKGFNWLFRWSAPYQGFTRLVQPPVNYSYKPGASPTGRYLILQDSARVDVWEFARGRIVATAEGRKVCFACLSQDETELVTVGYEGELDMVSIADGTRRSIRTGAGPVGGMQRPDGGLLPRGHANLFMVDLPSGQTTATWPVDNAAILHDEDAHVHSASLSPDGAFLAYHTTSGVVIVDFEPSSKMRARARIQDSSCRSMAWDGSERLLYTSSLKDEVQLHVNQLKSLAPNGEEGVVVNFAQSTGVLAHVLVGGDGETFATTMFDDGARVRVWKR